MRLRRLLDDISPEYRSGFIAELQRINAQKGLQCVVLFFALQLIAMVLPLIRHGGFYGGAALTARTLIHILAVVMNIVYLIYFLRVRRGAYKNLKLASYAVWSSFISICAYCLVLTLLDARDGVEYSPYLFLALVILALLPSAPFRYSLIATLSVEIAYVAALPFFLSDAALLVANYVSSAFLAVVALAARSMIYSSYQKFYISTRELSQKSELLAEVNHQLTVANQRLSDMSLTDQLTKIGNRRSFDQRMRIEWARAQRDNAPLSLLIIDIDDFKPYNDNYGHPEGDECLTQVADAVRNTVARKIDFVARYGGEEFVVISPSTGAEGAMLVANRICAAVQRLNIVHEYSRVADCVTVSVGVATMVPGRDTDMRLLPECADKALYFAKREGKNRAYAYDDFIGSDVVSHHDEESENVNTL